jgi:hypothetical protein
MQYRAGAWQTRRLRRQIEDALQGISLNDPADVDELCATIARRRCRHLNLETMPPITSPDAPCGILLEMEHADYIFVEESASQRHRAQIIRHELVHLLLGHRSDAAVEEVARSDLSAGRDVMRARGRTAYTTTQEEEAEIGASIMVEVLRRRAAAPWGSGRSGMVSRLSTALGPQREDQVR